MSTKQILIQAVLSQIQDDIARIDTEALSELLGAHLDDVALTNYLDDDRLEQYQKDTNTEVEVEDDTMYHVIGDYGLDTESELFRSNNREEAKESFVSNVVGGQTFDTVELGHFEKDGEWITLLESNAE